MFLTWLGDNSSLKITKLAPNSSTSALNSSTFPYQYSLQLKLVLFFGLKSLVLLHSPFPLEMLIHPLNTEMANLLLLFDIPQGLLFLFPCFCSNKHPSFTHFSHHIKNRIGTLIFLVNLGLSVDYSLFDVYNKGYS